MKMRHAHIHMRGIRGVALVEMGGPTLTITDANGKAWAFEDHRYCGPSVLKADGSTPADPQPGPKSEFWSCVSLWAQQGRRRAADGSCLWDAEPESELVHLGGRQYAIAGSLLAQRAQAQQKGPA
jgi:hypothetical protein